MSELMVKNVYYRKTNFSNGEFSKFFQKEIFEKIRNNQKYRLNLLKQVSSIRESGIEQLNQVIQECPEGKDKKQLLKFSHDFYNNRGDLGKKFQKIVFLLPPDLASEFDSYFKMKEQILMIDNRIEEQVDQQYLNEKQMMLQGLRDNLDFVQNTKMIGQTLYQKLEKLLKTDVKNHNKKQRQMDGFLYNYYTRIATKTSPLGLLGTTSVYGQEEFHLDREIFMSVNSSIILKIFDRLYQNPKNQPVLNFKLNETLILKENKYYVTVFNDIKGKSLYRNRQELVTLPESKILNEILQLFKGKGQLSGRDILDKLSQKGQENLLTKLLENCILLPADQLTIEGKQSMSEAFLQKLKGISSVMFSNEIEIFERIVAFEQEEFSWEIYDRLTEEVHNLVLYYGIEGFDKSSYVSIDKLASNTENDLEKEVQVVKEQQKCFNDLSKFISIFDISTRSKYLAYEMLRKKYGGEFKPRNAREMSKFLRDLSTTLFQRDGYWMESFGYLGEKYQHKIDNQLLKLKKEILEQLLGQDSGDGSELLISTELLNSSTKQLEKLVGQSHKSRAYFLQVSPSNQIVFNHIYKGYGVYRRRFNHYLPTDQESYRLDGALVDVPMTFGFNANIRESTDKTLSLPLGERAFASSEQLNWLDLGFRLSKQSKEIEVFEKATGAIIYPHFLGSLITVALPSLVAVFNSITLNDSIYFDFGELLLRQKIKNHSQEKVVVPRLCFEKVDFILSRKKWYLACEKLHTILQEDTSMGQKWLEVIEYFEEEELPLSFFVKDFFESYNQDSELLKTKPLYINFESFLSFKAFVGLVKKKDRILIEEVLPECTDTETDMITELIVETND